VLAGLVRQYATAGELSKADKRVLSQHLSAAKRDIARHRTSAARDDLRRFIAAARKVRGDQAASVLVRNAKGVLANLR